ncbi:MAG: 6-phosphofructokinase [Planctomycetota bacterium]
MRILINTGGGDAPGLNAVIRSVTLAAEQRGWDIYGSKNGYGGLLSGDGLMPLDRDRVRGITYLGGTILGTTSKGNPFAWPIKNADGTVVKLDRSDEVVKAFKRYRFDCCIAVGGDGSLAIAHGLWKKGIPMVGIPKTIDNDLPGTRRTFGFDTAVSVATDALGRLHSTAEAHERVMVVEVMGRNAGWIALYSGLAATADVVLIPEIPYDIGKVNEKIMERELKGRHFSIVVVAEGAMPRGGSVVTKGAGETGRQAPILGGIADVVAQGVREGTGKDVRTVVLGHLQRGGTPTSFDRLLALRFGAAAVRAVAAGQFGTLVAYDGVGIKPIPLEQALGTRQVDLSGDVIQTARALNISFGD